LRLSEIILRLVRNYFALEFALNLAQKKSPHTAGAVCGLYPPFAAKACGLAGAVWGRSKAL
jgi:hypothetical protein